MNAGRLPPGRLAAAVLARAAAGFVILLAMLVGAAGTVAYWEAWAYMGVLFLPVTLTVAYLLVNDPALLERRMRTKEPDEGQRLVVKLAAVLYLLAFLVPGLDRRFDWSRVPVAAVVVADVLVLLGHGWFLLVLRANSYASRVIELEPGQRVVTTGPYALVRHPMYLAVLVMSIATPVALGSWWAVIAALPQFAVLAARIRYEELLLVRELPGYEQYARNVRYRLIPGVW